MKHFIFFLLLLFSASLNADQENSNSLIVCKNGLEMFDYDLEFIRHANKSVEVSCCYGGGSLFRKLLTTVEERIKERPDLQFHLMVLKTTFDKGDDKFLSNFQKRYPKNVHVVFPTEDFMFIPDVGSTSHHTKVVLVDEKYFSTGGSNLDEVMCCDGTYPLPRNNKGGIAGPHLPAAQRDMDVVGNGVALAKEMRVHFFKLYALWEDYCKRLKFFSKDPEHYKNNKYFPVDDQDKPIVPLFENSPKKRDNIPIKLVNSGPYQKRSAIGMEYQKLIKEAKESLYIANLYFDPPNYLLDTFKDASNRGLNITLITNGIYDDSAFFAPLFGWLNRINYVPLFYGRSFTFFQSSKAKNSKVNNVKIYEYHIPDVLYHKKVLIVDKKKVIIGSYNLGGKSELHDYEMIIVIDSPQIAADFMEVLDYDLTFCESISSSQARKWYFDPIVDFKLHASQKMRGFY